MHKKDIAYSKIPPSVRRKTRRTTNYIQNLSSSDEDENDSSQVCIQMETFSEQSSEDEEEKKIEIKKEEENPKRNWRLQRKLKSDNPPRTTRYTNYDLIKQTRSKSLETFLPETLNLQRKTIPKAKSRAAKLRQVVSMVMERKFPKPRRPRFSALFRFSSSLNTRLLNAIEENNNHLVRDLLVDTVESNATCRRAHISACHLAAYANCEALSLLIDFTANVNRFDKFGRTPLHFAAWAGKNLAVAMILEIPDECLQFCEKNGVVTSENVLELQPSEGLVMELETEEKLKAMRPQFDNVIDVPCKLPSDTTLHIDWQDCYEHKCKKFMSAIPKFFPGWTPLHVASYAAHGKTARLLLTAGANPNSKDAMGLTPLDVAGSACFQENCKVDVDNYVETIQNLIEFGGKLKRTDMIPSIYGCALHTAVHLCSVEAIQLLLDAGASVALRNPQGNTPLHECVLKRLKEPLKILALHGQENALLNVTDKNGYTVLQSAVLAPWIPGVCVALFVGADVTFQADNGFTAIHLAAREGNTDILNALLNNLSYKSMINDLENMKVETPLFCAIRSGNIACVQTILDEEASLELTTYAMMDQNLVLHNVDLQDLNMIVHATAQAGFVEILEFILDYDKDLEKLLDYRCPYLKHLLPVEFAAFHGNTDMCRFLLKRTVSRNAFANKSFDPSRLLDILISKNRDDIFRDLLIVVPDAVSMSISKGHYPLHNAIKHCDRNIILLLINNGADLSQRDQSGNTAISLFSEHRSNSTEFIASIFDCYIYPSDYSSENHHLEVIIDYRVLIPIVEPLKEERQMRVLEALLKTGNRDDQRKLLAHPLVESFLFLKWKSLRTFYYFLVFIYSLFVISLSVYIGSVFYYIIKNETDPYILEQWFWREATGITLVIIILLELLCTTLRPKSWKSRICSIEFWVKFVVFGFSYLSIMSVNHKFSNKEVPRHLASLTLMLAWLMFSVLLSRIPSTGYYMQMYWTVLKKIISILLSFFFLIILFSLCFMIEFQFTEPFDGPWSAFVKTLVMMTSEFEYGSTFTNKMADQMSTTKQILQIIFVTFMILTAIVLMNLMTGVAVHDVQDLILDGNLRRLDKQVRFLSRLEFTGHNKPFQKSKMACMTAIKKVPQILKITAANDANVFEKHITKSLINKAQEKIAKVNKKEKVSMEESKFEELLQAVNELKSIVSQMQKSQRDNEK